MILAVSSDLLVFALLVPYIAIGRTLLYFDLEAEAAAAPAKGRWRERRRRRAAPAEAKPGPVALRR